MPDAEVEYVGIRRGENWYPSIEGTPMPPSASAPRCTVDEFLDLCTPSPPSLPAPLALTEQNHVNADGDPSQNDEENTLVNRSSTPVIDLTHESTPAPAPPTQTNPRPRRATRLDVDYRVPTEDDLPPPEVALHPRSRHDWADNVRSPTPPPVYYRRSDWAGANAPPISPPSRVREPDWVRRAATPPMPLDSAIAEALRSVQPDGPLNQSILEEEIRRIRAEIEASDGAEAGYLWECLEMFIRYCDQRHWP